MIPLQSLRATLMKGQAGAQATAEQPSNATHSQLMIRNLLRIATYNITYLRCVPPPRVDCPLACISAPSHRSSSPRGSDFTEAGSCMTHQRTLPRRALRGAQHAGHEPQEAHPVLREVRPMMHVSTSRSMPSYTITPVLELRRPEYSVRTATDAQHPSHLRSCSSERVIELLEEGVFDALEHKYLRTMMLGLCDSENPAVLLEAYEFHFRYISAEDNGGEDAIAMDFDNKTFSTKSSKAGSSKTPSQDEGTCV